MTYQRPMCPPSRRKLLAILAAIPVATLVTPASAAVPSLALLGALEDLEAIRTTLNLATRCHADAMAEVDQWERDNPSPASKRGRRRWEKKSSVVYHTLTDDTWQALMTAETNFRQAQAAVAAIGCNGPADLRLLVEAAITYDAVDLYMVNRAPIAQAVARYIGGQS